MLIRAGSGFKPLLYSFFLSIVQHQWHYQHQQVFVLPFIRGFQDAGFGGGGKLNADLIPFGRIQHFDQELGVKSNLHILTGVLAAHTLITFKREVHILGRQLQLAAANVQRYLVGAFIGEHAYTL